MLPSRTPVGSNFDAAENNLTMRNWDERYSSETYAYGTAPNEFLAANAEHLPPGRLLCLADGEGRNGVWLAEQGFTVTSVDASGVGLAKARKLAESRGVTVETVHADLGDYEIGSDTWDGIVSIFAHLPPELRARVHQRCVAGLRPGGVMLLEAYQPAQLDYGTGGPPSSEMMMTDRTLQEELRGLEFLSLEEKEREVREGQYHTGLAAVVQMIARKPG
ncbi:class I SAM-dependent methyltransferase [Marinobacteraceae bacterium S3BR75-40.1]